MATNSVQYENYADAIIQGTTFANRSSDWGGKLRIYRFDVQTAASAAGEILNLVVVPAQFVYLCTWLNYEGTASLTLDIGDADDTDRLVNDAALGSDNPTSASLWTGFYSRIDSTAFGTSGPDGNTSSAISVGFGYKYTADTLIYGTTAGATATAGEVIRGAIIGTIA
jgi:hypothetical protein